MTLERMLGECFAERSLEASVRSIREHTREAPRCGLILGSGWGGVRRLVQDAVSIPVERIPHFPHPSVSGHKAELVFGRLARQSVVLLLGRKHLYEGEGLAAPLYSIEVFRRLGVQTLGLTNAAGALHSGLCIGDLMVVRDHLDSTWHRLTAPLSCLGADERRTPPAAGRAVYDPEFVQRLLDAGREEGLSVRAGVYGFTLGPFYETPAEVRCLAAWGCDAVGMSTVPEALYARIRGLRVFALSAITNMGTGLAEAEHSHESVKEQAALLAPRATRLLERFIRSLDDSGV